MTTLAIRSLAAIALLSATAFAVATPAVAKSKYDGNWSVLIITQKGECDRGYRYPVRITDGTVGYAGESSFSVSGRVGTNGAVTVTVARGDLRANGSGQLGDSAGSGTWHAGQCSGTWEAERRS